MSESGNAVRILVTDDHKIVREGLIGMLSSQPDLQAVGEAADGQETITKVAELQPDVVVMDISMPRLNGIEATREIVERFPETAIIGLSLHDKEDLGTAMQEAGAVTYLQKDGASHTWIDAIRKICGSTVRSEDAKTP